MTTTYTSKRKRNSEEIPISKRRRQEEQGSDWSDLPDDVLENTVRRLRWVDRIWIQAVCKAWSIPDRNIPAPVGEVPCAMVVCFNPTYYNDQIQYNVGCRLLDPVSQKHIGTVLVREEYSSFFLDSRPLAFKYGWVLYKERDFYKQTIKSLFLYSPFTNEVVKLPRLPVSSSSFQVATFSLNANSPKCFIFLLWVHRGEIGVRICSPGDKSWKTFEFNGFFYLNSAVDATYANGVFYCVFDKGQLGAFNVEREEWSLLLARSMALPGFRSKDFKLIAHDVDLLLLSSSQPSELLKFDFSKMYWDYEDNLKDHVFFIGRTSFSAATVGETSKLANTVFSSCWLHPAERSSYENTFYSQSRPLYQECVEETKCQNCVEMKEFQMQWIELPSSGVWRANDLIHAV